MASSADTRTIRIVVGADVEKSTAELTRNIYNIINKVNRKDIPVIKVGLSAPTDSIKTLNDEVSQLATALDDVTGRNEISLKFKFDSSSRHAGVELKNLFDNLVAFKVQSERFKLGDMVKSIESAANAFGKLSDSIANITDVSGLSSKIQKSMKEIGSIVSKGITVNLSGGSTSASGVGGQQTFTEAPPNLGRLLELATRALATEKEYRQIAGADHNAYGEDRAQKADSLRGLREWIGNQAEIYKKVGLDVSTSITDGIIKAFNEILNPAAPITHNQSYWSKLGVKQGIDEHRTNRDDELYQKMLGGSTKIWHAYRNLSEVDEAQSKGNGEKGPRAYRYLESLGALQDDTKAMSKILSDFQRDVGQAADEGKSLNDELYNYYKGQLDQVMANAQTDERAAMLKLGVNKGEMSTNPNMRDKLVTNLNDWIEEEVIPQTIKSTKVPNTEIISTQVRDGVRELLQSVISDTLDRVRAEGKQGNTQYQDLTKLGASLHVGSDVDDLANAYMQTVLTYEELFPGEKFPTRNKMSEMLISSLFHKYGEFEQLNEDLSDIASHAPKVSRTGLGQGDTPESQARSALALIEEARKLKVGAAGSVIGKRTEHKKSLDQAAAEWQKVLDLSLNVEDAIDPSVIQEKISQALTYTTQAFDNMDAYSGTVLENETKRAQDKIINEVSELLRSALKLIPESFTKAREYIQHGIDLPHLQVERGTDDLYTKKLNTLQYSISDFLDTNAFGYRTDMSDEDRTYFGKKKKQLRKISTDAEQKINDIRNEVYESPEGLLQLVLSYQELIQTYWDIVEEIKTHQLSDGNMAGIKDTVDAAKKITKGKIEKSPLWMKVPVDRSQGDIRFGGQVYTKKSFQEFLDHNLRGFEENRYWKNDISFDENRFDEIASESQKKVFKSLNDIFEDYQRMESLAESLSKTRDIDPGTQQLATQYKNTLSSTKRAIDKQIGYFKGSFVVNDVWGDSAPGMNTRELRNFSNFVAERRAELEPIEEILRSGFNARYPSATKSTSQKGEAQTDTIPGEIAVIVNNNTDAVQTLTGAVEKATDAINHSSYGGGKGQRSKNAKESGGSSKEDQTTKSPTDKDWVHIDRSLMDKLTPKKSGGRDSKNFQQLRSIGNLAGSVERLITDHFKSLAEYRPLSAEEGQARDYALDIISKLKDDVAGHFNGKRGGNFANQDGMLQDMRNRANMVFDEIEGAINNPQNYSDKERAARAARVKTQPDTDIFYSSNIPTVPEQVGDDAKSADAQVKNLTQDTQKLAETSQVAMQKTDAFYAARDELTTKAGLMQGKTFTVPSGKTTKSMSIEELLNTRAFTAAEKGSISKEIADVLIGAKGDGGLRASIRSSLEELNKLENTSYEDPDSLAKGIATYRKTFRALVDDLKTVRNLTSGLSRTSNTSEKAAAIIKQLPMSTRVKQGDLWMSPAHAKQYEEPVRAMQTEASKTAQALNAVEPAAKKAGTAIKTEFDKASKSVEETKQDVDAVQKSVQSTEQSANKLRSLPDELSTVAVDMPKKGRTKTKSKSKNKTYTLADKSTGMIPDDNTSYIAPKVSKATTATTDLGTAADIADDKINKLSSAVAEAGNTSEAFKQTNTNLNASMNQYVQLSLRRLFAELINGAEPEVIARVAQDYKDVQKLQASFAKDTGMLQNPLSEKQYKEYYDTIQGRHWTSYGLGTWNHQDKAPLEDVYKKYTSISSSNLTKTARATIVQAISSDLEDLLQEVGGSKEMIGNVHQLAESTGEKYWDVQEAQIRADDLAKDESTLLSYVSKAVKDGIVTVGEIIELINQANRQVERTPITSGQLNKVRQALGNKEVPTPEKSLLQVGDQYVPIPRAALQTWARQLGAADFNKYPNADYRDFMYNNLYRVQELINLSSTERSAHAPDLEEWKNSSPAAAFYKSSEAKLGQYIAEIRGIFNDLSQIDKLTDEMVLERMHRYGELHEEVRKSVGELLTGEAGKQYLSWKDKRDKLYEYTIKTGPNAGKKAHWKEDEWIDRFANIRIAHDKSGNEYTQYNNPWYDLYGFAEMNRQQRRQQLQGTPDQQFQRNWNAMFNAVAEKYFAQLLNGVDVSKTQEMLQHIENLQNIKGNYEEAQEKSSEKDREAAGQLLSEEFEKLFGGNAAGIIATASEGRVIKGTQDERVVLFNNANTGLSNALAGVSGSAAATLKGIVDSIQTNYIHDLNIAGRNGIDISPYEDSLITNMRKALQDGVLDVTQIANIIHQAAVSVGRFAPTTSTGQTSGSSEQHDASEIAVEGKDLVDSVFDSQHEVLTRLKAAEDYLKNEMVAIESGTSTRTKKEQDAVHALLNGTSKVSGVTDTRQQFEQIIADAAKNTGGMILMNQNAADIEDRLLPYFESKVSAFRDGRATKSDLDKEVVRELNKLFGVSGGIGRGSGGKGSGSSEGGTGGVPPADLYRQILNAATKMGALEELLVRAGYNGSSAEVQEKLPKFYETLTKAQELQAEAQAATKYGTQEIPAERVQEFGKRLTELTSAIALNEAQLKGMAQDNQFKSTGALATKQSELLSEAEATHRNVIGQLSRARGAGIDISANGENGAAISYLQEFEKEYRNFKAATEGGFKPLGFDELVQYMQKLSPLITKANTGVEELKTACTEWNTTSFNDFCGKVNKLHNDMERLGTQAQKVGISVQSAAGEQYEAYRDVDGELDKIIEDLKVMSGSGTLDVQKLDDLWGRFQNVNSTYRNYGLQIKGDIASKDPLSSGNYEKKIQNYETTLTSLLAKTEALKATHERNPNAGGTSVDALTTQAQKAKDAVDQLKATIAGAGESGQLGEKIYSREDKQRIIKDIQATELAIENLENSIENDPLTFIPKLSKKISELEGVLKNASAAKYGQGRTSYMGLSKTVGELNDLYKAIVGGTNGKTNPEIATMLKAADTQMRQFTAEAKGYGEYKQDPVGRFGTLAGKFTSWFSITRVIMTLYRGIRQMVTNVVDLDTAMTELKKVTNETATTYDIFLTNAADRAKQLGTSLTDIVTATADFARLGYSIGEAENLADVSTIYKNVGDGIDDINEASESVIATMQAFGITADNAMSIVDKFNAVGK